jgi:hypothetical protein
MAAGSARPCQELGREASLPSRKPFAVGPQNLSMEKQDREFNKAMDCLFVFQFEALILGLLLSP